MDQKSDVIVVIGPKKAGKTSVVNSLAGEKVTKRYSESRDLEKKNTIVDGRQLEIWDTPSSYTIDQVSSLNPNIILVVLEFSALVFAKDKADMLEKYVPKEKLDNNTQIYVILNKRDSEEEFAIPICPKKTARNFCEEIKKEKGYDVTIIRYSARDQRPETAERKNPIWDKVLERPELVKEQKPAWWNKPKEGTDSSTNSPSGKRAWWKKSKGSASSVEEKQDEQKERLLPPSPG